MDRYIILVGGYQYGDVAHPSSSVLTDEMAPGNVPGRTRE